MRIKTKWGEKTISHGLLKAHRTSAVALMNYLKGDPDIQNNEHVIAGKRIHDIAADLVSPETDKEKRFYDQTKKWYEDFNITAVETPVTYDYKLGDVSYDGFGIADAMSKDSSVIIDIKSYYGGDDGGLISSKKESKIAEAEDQIAYYHMMVYKLADIHPNKGVVILAPTERDENGNLGVCHQFFKCELLPPTVKEMEQNYSRTLTEIAEIVELVKKWQ